MTRFTLFLSVLLGWLAAGPTAQAQSLNIAAPNTAALGRHGDYPVNLSTGVPEISIPLYTIQTKDITVPITLSYHASGIKVSDVASWVGLGWSLNAGGAIRRKVQGKPDESSEGYLAPAIPIRSDIQPSVSCCVQTNVDYLRDVMINAKDGQPDVFRYNFPGGDGSFVFNKQGQAINIPLSPTRVSYQRLTPSGAFAQFDLTASNGTQFTFQGAEGGASNGLSSAWVLNKIRSPYNDEVNFAYQANSSVSSYSRPPDRLTVRDQYIATGQASCASLQSGVLPVITGSQQIEQYQEQLLDEITFAQGRVKFFAVADRQDWLVTNKRLSAIEVQVRHPVTGAYQLLRRIEFGHGYFIEGQASNSQGKRLKLNQVVIKGNDGAVVQTYRFEYDERPLPSPNTTAKDYWGYYNGKTSNKDLIPNRSIPFIGNGGQLQQLPIGTNNHPQGRDADPAFMQVGVLKRMYYPTGGFTDFEYETNRYLDPATQALTYAGGLRVKKITSHPLSGQAVSKIYKYGLNESGLGRPNALNTSPTNPFLFTNVSTKKRNVITGPCTLFGESLRERTISSDPITELDAYDGTSVFYEYVTEYLGNENGEQGKTVYKFSDVQDFVRFLPRSSSRPYRESRHWLRGRLLEKTVFKQGDNCSFKAVAQTQNVYSTNLISYDNAGIVVGQHTEDIGEVAQCSPTQPAYCGNYEWFNYSVATGDNLLTSTTETLYDQGPTNNTLVNTTTYTYNNFQQLVRTQTTDSKGEALTSETRYPTDYNLTAPNPTPAAAALLALQAQNRVGTPVEQFSYKGSLANGNRRVLGASAYVYQRNPAAPDQVVLGQAYTLETAQPRLWNNQWNDNFAPLIGADGNLPATVPAHYPRKVDNVRFDARGTVLETAPVDGVRMATLYAYKGTTPVAQMAHNEAVPVQPPPGNQQVQATLFNPAYTAVWTAFPNLQTFTLAGPNQVIVTVDMGCLTPGCPPLGSGLCSYQFEMALQNTANPALLYPAIASTSTGGNCGFRTVSNQVALPAGTYRLVWKAPVASGPSSYQISPRVVIPGVVATPGQNYWHYTSFEEGPNEGTGTDPRIVPGGKTGRYAYNLGGGGSLALPGNWLALANGKKYTLSYWYQTAVGGPWLLFEQKYLPSALPASLTQAGTGALRVDELRVFPEDAMVSTLTADPLVGVTSTADENNLTASTEYDAAQRPRLAREQDGNIVKKWEYQFTTDSTTPASQAGAINWATETWNIPIAQEVFVTALADLDNNGTKDLAILNRSAQSVRFFRYKPNCANGEWEEGAPLVVPNEAGVVNITVGDYNQDGTPDLALILHPPNINSNARLQIRLGNGSPFVPGGSYSIAATYNLGPRWATQLIQTDLNLDGKLDLVATRLSLEPENERLYWFMGQGDGTFTRNAVNVGATDIQAAWDVAAGDLNGDGWPDLALPVGHSNYIYIYPNNKQGGFDPPILFNATHPQAGTSSQFHFIKLADLNQDGKLDMMGTSHQNTMNIVSFINQGNFTFTKNNLVVYSDLTNLFQLSQPGDYNQDGKIDLMVNRRDGIYLYPGQGDGTFANTPVFAAPVLATQYWQNTYTMQYRDFGTPQDVNGDGILDLVLTHPGKVSIYLGQRGAVTTTPLANPSYVREHTYLAKVADEASLAGLTTAAGQVLTGTQYYDGLGRPLQAVGHQLSPELKDVVQPVAYDPYGRQPRAYLPYTVAPNLANRYRANALGGANYPASEQFAFYNPANAAANPTVAKDNFPFADTDFERSPLSRPLRQGAPGADWQMPTQPWDFTPNQATDHTVKAFGRANTAADQVRILRVDGLDPANLAWPVIAANVGQYYAPGQLWVTTSHDEDNKTLHQFTDRLGRPVLKRVETGDPARPWAETAYVYDDQERLVAVLQPEAVKLVRDANAANAAVSINKFTRYAYLYVYDARGRLIHHLTPDQAENNWTSLVYDRRDRPVLSQGPRYVGTGQWHVTKYDHLDRPVLTGWATLANQTRAQLQTTLDGATHAYEVRSNAADSRWGHSNRTFPALAANQVFTASYYDLYDLDGDGQPDPGLAPSASPALNAAEVQPTTSLAHRGRAVASRRARLQGESSTVPGTVYQDLVYYDKYGRPVQTQADNHSGGRETASLWFDYAGRLRRSQQVHLRSLTALPVVTDQRFTLDHVGRPLRVFQRVTANGQVQPEVLTAALTYNELGQMVQKQLHATDSCTFAQAIDYRYTLRGWLKSINGEDAPATSAKLFRFRLTYQDHTDAARRRYNGNITSTEWQTAQAGQNNVRRGYDYTYDAMNRLLAANYKVLNPGGNTPGPAPLPGENHTVDNLTYDRNGNLLTLRRYGATTGTPDPQTGRVNATAHGVVDQLTYAYTAGSNRLLNVTDATPTANNFGGQTWRADFHDGGYGNPDYLYDAAGNLTADGNRGLSGVLYNYLDLPYRQNGTDYRTTPAQGSRLGQVQTDYDAAGGKLQKRVLEYAWGTTTVTKTTTTDYHGGLVYTTVDGLPAAAPDFMAFADGRVVNPALHPTGLPGGVGFGHPATYEYHYTDHQGNLRLAYRPKYAEAKHLLTFETANASTEEANWVGVATTRDATRARTGTRSGKLPAGATTRLGKLGSQRLAVQPGQLLTAGVWIYTTDTPPFGINRAAAGQPKTDDAVVGVPTNNNSANVLVPTAGAQSNIQPSPLSVSPTSVSPLSVSPTSVSPRTSFNSLFPLLLPPMSGPAPGNGEGQAKPLPLPRLNLLALPGLVKALFGRKPAPAPVSVSPPPFVSPRTSNMLPPTSVSPTSVSPPTFVSPRTSDATPLRGAIQPVLTVQFYNAANQPLGAPQTRTGSQGPTWAQMLLRDVPVPCGAAWAEVYVEQTATDYQTWLDDFEITLLGAPVAEIVQESHNDPWGLELSGLNYQTGRKNQWQANGKTERESNFGLNVLETAFRGYDPALGRFHQPDAITDLLPGISSYTFGFNNPVYFNDPTGLVGESQAGPAYRKASERPEDPAGWSSRDNFGNITYHGVNAQGAVMSIQGGVNQGGGTGHPTVASVAEQVYWSGQKYDGNSSIGQAARQAGLEQNYLGDFAPEAGAMFASLMQSEEFNHAEVTQLAQLRTATVTQVKTQYMMGIFSPDNVGSILMLAGASLGQPYQGRVLQMVRRYAWGRGFGSFTAFKRAMGPAGAGKAWHHIVEQTPGNTAKFGTHSVHNTRNLIRLAHGPGSIHEKVSAYYSSKDIFTGGKTVRQWLSTQSYKAQYDFGIQTLKKFGWTP